MKYVCQICGYVYDDAKEKVPFSKLPDDWKCPLCGAAKSDFKAEETSAEQTKSASVPMKKASEEKAALQIAESANSDTLYRLMRQLWQNPKGLLRRILCVNPGICFPKATTLTNC